MRNDKHIAIKLRQKGKSYNKISKELNISKGTLSAWFSGVKWSKDIKKELTKKANYISCKRLRLINKARIEKWEKWREGFREEAIENFSTLKENPLFVAGINIYWGEGDSVLKNGVVRVANTDYRMLAIFYKFLKTICKIPEEKISAWLLIYPDISESICKDFWQIRIDLKPSQFKKTQVIKGRHPTKRLKNGVCTLQVYSRGLKEKIITWINLLSNEIMRA